MVSEGLNIKFPVDNVIQICVASSLYILEPKKTNPLYKWKIEWGSLNTQNEVLKANRLDHQQIANSRKQLTSYTGETWLS